MRNLLAPIISISALTLLAACSPESANMALITETPTQTTEVPQYEKVPAQKFSWVTEDGGQSQLDFNPQVDILFVTDDSDSMKSAQENLVANIDKFTSGIVKNKMIDYHIGVISTWDSSERYAQAKKDQYQMGQLRFIKDSKGQSYNQRFVTKSQRQLLSSSLNIGVTPYSKGGPEVEEFFSPLAAALENSGRGGVNEGFFRDSAQLVVIVMTDADDSTSRISPEQMARSLIEFKGNNPDKVSVYGVLVNKKDADQYKDWDLRVHPKYHPECFETVKNVVKNNGKCTEGFGPDRLEKLILEANKSAGTPDLIRSKFIMSIVSKKFGADLARIGDDITVKTLAKEIFLSQRPRVDEKGNLMVRVRYGKNQVIAQKAQGGWVYDPENNSILLSGDIQYQYEEGARFSVDLIPLTLKN